MDSSDKLDCPKPVRKYNINHLEFMQAENVKFYSENIHMSKPKDKKPSVTGGMSFFNANPDKKNKRMQFLKDKRAQLGLNFKIAALDEDPVLENKPESDEEGQNKGEPKLKAGTNAEGKGDAKHKEDTKETNSDDKGEGEAQKGRHSPAISGDQIDRCSNPSHVSEVLGKGLEGCFDDISEEDEDGEGDKSF
jgi:hypothetical protein